jgi:hypothetical protein
MHLADAHRWLLPRHQPSAHARNHRPAAHHRTTRNHPKAASTATAGESTDDTPGQHRTPARTQTTPRASTERRREHRRHPGPAPNAGRGTDRGNELQLRPDAGATGPGRQRLGRPAPGTLLRAYGRRRRTGSGVEPGRRCRTRDDAGPILCGLGRNQTALANQAGTVSASRPRGPSRRDGHQPPGLARRAGVQTAASASSTDTQASAAAERSTASRTSWTCSASAKDGAGSSPAAMAARRSRASWVKLCS